MGDAVEARSQEEELTPSRSPLVALRYRDFRLYWMGQLVSLVGACGLFLPSFILSNVAQGSVGSLPARLVSTLLLLAESLGLFTLGMVTRVRYLLLGGTGLVVIGAIEALIYATSHSQQAGVILVWLALAVSGGALIGGAAFLTLRRSTT